MKKRIFFTCLLAAFIFNAEADEGLWLPVLLEQLNQDDMQSKGLKLTAEDIYSINNSSLKDAVCLFGGGCTAGVVSEQGLILTNHHCGYSSIQSHSTLEKNYLADGFWAATFKDELPNTGLSVTFLVRMEDVTTKVLEGVQATMTEAQREEIINANTAVIEKEAVKDSHYKAKIKPFCYGNEYYLFISEVFTDIRLVGAPPVAIGNFGGDTDNWMWPRHTGDFSVFRIYADSSNNPAGFSEKNVPYKPAKSLEISLKGVKQDDFTMVFGYPGRTQEYLTSYAVNLTGNVENPVMYGIRDAKLKIMGAAMKENPEIKLQYSAKYAGVANFWKKMAGESKGLRTLNAVEKKKNLENDFVKWANAENTRKKKYGGLITEFEKVYQEYTPVALANDYFNEAINGNEIVRYAWGFNNFIKKCNDKSVSGEEIKKLADQVKTNAKAFFKNYDQPTDKKVFTALLDIYCKNSDPKYQPGAFAAVIKTKYNGDIEKFADFIYSKSFFVSNEKIQKIFSNFKRNKVRKITADPLFTIASELYTNHLNNILPSGFNYRGKLDSLYRIYITGLREMLPEKKFYPDANFTMRLAYGRVAGYKPTDGVDYSFQTTLAGVMMKEDEDISDYSVPAKLKELYKTRDYGRYSSDTTMYIAFIATNHTTGGNSGSPVLNGEGQLTGINFDRVWEGTMSDIMFDPDKCRNISLDIRYALFIIDKYAGATRLIDEMKITD